MITAIILAAGESKRMGQPKMLLPWENEVVITRVISIFKNVGVDDILVITGGAREQVEDATSGYGVNTIFNKDFGKEEMLSSIQCGLREITDQTQAVLIGLGDQPQVQERSVRMVCDTFREIKSNIVIPSFKMRRGHPWLVGRALWNDLLEMKSPQSPRDYLNAHANDIHYIDVNDPGILADLDTPEEYKKWQPSKS